MTQERINIGTLPNDGEGDPLRVAFAKINNNFTKLFGTNWVTTQSSTFDDTNQIIFSTAANEFTQAQFQINSVNPNTNDSQNIMLTASISNDLLTVKFTAHSTMINGDYAVSNYDMDIIDGMVNIYVKPTVNSHLTHFIGYQIMFNNNINVMSPMLLQNNPEVLKVAPLLVAGSSNSEPLRVLATSMRVK